MPVRNVRLGLLQRARPSSLEASLEEVSEEIRSLAAAGAQIICLPEMFRTPYFCQSEDPAVFDLAEPLDGPTSVVLGPLARECGIVLIAPIFERRLAGVYHNSALIFGPEGRRIGLYRKMHIPDDPNFYEKFYFTPGDLGFPVIETPWCRIAVLICWDQWFPEAARLATLAGAEILFYPTAIGWLDGESDEDHRDQLAAWRGVQVGHAIANGVFIAATNRVGREGQLRFWGHSFVADPQGRLVALAGAEAEPLMVNCELERIDVVRRIWPFLRDRRIDAYGDLTRRLLD